jgi:hypothetical protein
VCFQWGAAEPDGYLARREPGAEDFDRSVGMGLREGMRICSGWCGEHLARRATENGAGDPFELIAPPDEGPSQFVVRHRPLRLIEAIWQRFAEEIPVEP